ncbi:MAG: hypothetical protein NTW19_01435, partial [Planctomycetota bacterium]|nr:hypothetical protein [Planctomycetota bacterium]
RGGMQALNFSHNSSDTRKRDLLTARPCTGGIASDSIGYLIVIRIGSYVKLGNDTRFYPVEGKIKLFIPNSLAGQSTFEWDDDYATVVIPDPVTLRFPSPNP